MAMTFLARHFLCQLSFSVFFLEEVPKNLVDDVLLETCGEPGLPPGGQTLKAKSAVYLFFALSRTRPFSIDLLLPSLTRRNGPENATCLRTIALWVPLHRGSPMRRSRSSNRGSARRMSNLGSILSWVNLLECSPYAFSSQLKA